MGNDRVAVITGASRGIGRAIALELAQAGYHIVGLSRTQPKELIEAVEARGVSFMPLQADISDVGRHEALADEIEKGFGRIDLLVNNAGVAPLKRRDLLETTLESFDRVLSVNLRGPFFFTQAMARRMKAMGGSPKIVFITSISSEFASINRPEYCVSKAGLSMVSTLFAQRMAEWKIPVYEIRPGLIETEMTAPVRKEYDRRIAEGLVPLNRWGKPEDVAGAVRVLAEGALAYSTGSVIDLSGGLILRRL